MCETLSYSDFSVEGKYLRINIPGSYAVLVFAPTKNDSLMARQVLNKLNIEGLKKACLDIGANANRNVIRISLTTATPVRRVPMLFLVVDGKIKAVYNKDLSVQSVTTWFREKMHKFRPINEDPRSRKAEGVATLYRGEESSVVSRKRRNADIFTMSRQQDRGMVEERSTGAPTGINAAWRVDNPSSGAD